MSKHERIEEDLARLAARAANVRALAGLHPNYAGYFVHFNAADYYQAHDVLEDLWLRDAGPDRDFYKGLIQFAGAFVHLKKQRERPSHPTDGARLRPADRLFRLALANIEPYGPLHQRLDIADVRRLGLAHLEALAASGWQANPWDPAAPPQLLPALPQPHT